MHESLDELLDTINNPHPTTHIPDERMCMHTHGQMTRRANLLTCHTQKLVQGIR